jgi:5'-3' exonuclease
MYLAWQRQIHLKIERLKEERKEHTKVWMGIKGLYSCLKPHCHPVDFKQVEPCRLALDAYPFLYKFKYDMDGCISLFKQLQEAGHTCHLYVDGNPPKEKLEELAQRRQQREQAYQQAQALKLFLNDTEKSSSLDEQARKLIEKQIAAYEVESYSIKKETREVFLKRVKEETSIPVILCEGESDIALIQAALKGEVDAVIANDMDLFVGGVERLWILGKTNADPLFQEFQRSILTKTFGLYSKSWTDVAILAGYEKTPQLKRTSVQQAITWIRYYGSLESLLTRRPELLQQNTLQEFLEARRFF